MVVEKQAAIIGSVIDNLVAEGKQPEAIALLDQYTGVDPVTKKPRLLEGHKSATQLESKVGAFRQEVEARKEFDTMLGEVPVSETTGRPSIAAMQAKIFEVRKTDPAKADRLKGALGNYSARWTAADQEQADAELKFAYENPDKITPQSLATLQRVSPLG